MVKRCCYGTCKSDTRYPEQLLDDVKFVPFPKPAKNTEKCQRWIRLCGRPHEQLNITILQERSKAKHLYVCTKVTIQYLRFCFVKCLLPLNFHSKNRTLFMKYLRIC